MQRGRIFVGGDVETGKAVFPSVGVARDGRGRSIHLETFDGNGTEIIFFDGRDRSVSRVADGVCARAVCDRRQSGDRSGIFDSMRAVA